MRKQIITKGSEYDRGIKVEEIGGHTVEENRANYSMAVDR